jgi:hypothetical protein
LSSEFVELGFTLLEYLEFTTFGFDVSFATSFGVDFNSLNYLTD